jgi:hypothetical protein
MIRWRDFYPVLVWPAADQASRTPILTHDRRLNWTLDVSLETDPDVLSSLYEVAVESGSSPMSGLTADPSKHTLQDLQKGYSPSSSVRNYAGSLQDRGGYVVV